MKHLNSSPGKNSLQETAAFWFVALQDADLSPSMLRRWQKWAAFKEHRDAFDEIEALWLKMDEMPQLPVPDAAQRAADNYTGVTSVSAYLDEHAQQAHARHKRTFPRYALPLAAAVAAFLIGVGIIAAVLLRSDDNDTSMAVYETAVAQHQDVLLEDGSRIQLGARTALTTSVNRHVRAVVIDRGEALFDVAHDKERPFRVTAGRNTITAVGTAFNVRRLDDGHVVVTVTEGTVEISHNKSPSQSGQMPLALRVAQGHEISYEEDGALSAVLTDSGDSIAWKNGRLQYRSEPLKHVINDVNRYSRRAVIVGDMETGQRLYSGTVFERDVDDWIAGLEKTFPGVRVVETDPHHVLVRKRLPNEQ